MPGAGQVYKAVRIGETVRAAEHVAQTASTTVKAEGVAVKIETIMTSPKNLIPTQSKSELTGSQVKRLTKDMKANGFDPNHPVSAQRNERGRLEITDGHHRTEAAIKAGIEKIPVEVVSQ